MITKYIILKFGASEERLKILGGIKVEIFKKSKKTLNKIEEFYKVPI